MIQIQCTKKLYTFLNLPLVPSLPKPDTDKHEVWFADIIPYGKIFFILFVHHPTLYSIITMIEERISFEQFQGLFIDDLLATLFLDGVKTSNAMLLLNKNDNISFSKTSSRSMLGSMNDLIDHLLWQCDDAMEKSGRIDLYQIVSFLNRIPQRKLEWNYAVDVMYEKIKKINNKI